MGDILFHEGADARIRPAAEGDLRPYGPKRIQEALGGAWFIFGEATDGTVDIADEQFSTLFSKVPRAAAERLIAARGVFLDAVAAGFMPEEEARRG